MRLLNKISLITLCLFVLACSSQRRQERAYKRRLLNSKIDSTVEITKIKYDSTFYRIVTATSTLAGSVDTVFRYLLAECPPENKIGIVDKIQTIQTRLNKSFIIEHKTPISVSNITLVPKQDSAGNVTLEVGRRDTGTVSTTVRKKISIVCPTCEPVLPWKITVATMSLLLLLLLYSIIRQRT